LKGEVKAKSSEGAVKLKNRQTEIKAEKQSNSFNQKNHEVISSKSNHAPTEINGGSTERNSVPPY
jgi:hypothetical protein